MEYVYLGYDNDIRLILKQNAVASSLSSVTRITFVIGQAPITSVNGSNDPIRWIQDGYATGEVRMDLGGYKLITTWTVHSGSVWKAAVATAPSQLFIDGTLGTKKTSIATCTASGYWTWESGYVYLYYASDPDTLSNPGVQGEWPIKAGVYKHCPIIVYDSTNTDGIVWGSDGLDVTVYGRRGGGPFIP